MLVDACLNSSTAPLMRRKKRKMALFSTVSALQNYRSQCKRLTASSFIMLITLQILFCLQYSTRSFKVQGWQIPVMLLLPVLLLVSIYSSSWRGLSGSDQAVIHQVVTESITRTNGENATTTTVRQEQRSVAHVTTKGGAGSNNGGSSLKDWLSGTVNPRTSDAAAGDEDAPSHVVSKAVVQVSASGTGLMNKFYYRFDNVQLSRDKITVYYDPDTFIPPTEEHWVDIISGNTTTAQLPTMIVLKGDLHNTQWFYLPVEYLPATEHQPNCASWINRMAYLLQVRYSYNVWHTWNEGLMGIFQTLRELGQLPMASVGPDGKLEEILDGMLGEDCAFVYDHSQDKVVPETHCAPRTGLLERTQCDPKKELWCKPGAVVSARRASGGPIIVPYTASSVMNVWAHLYSSMTQDIRDWSEIEGSCFRSIVLGKSATLNFYQAINNTEVDPKILDKYPLVDNLETRVEAMAVFKQFVLSAQKEYVEAEAANGAAPWEGYRSRALERLRRGVGPENLREGVLDGINAREVPGMLREERHELTERWKRHDQLVEKAVERYMERYGGASEARGAAISEGRQYVDDYEDDYEGVAAKTLNHQQDGLLEGAGKDADRDELTATKKKLKRTSLRRNLLKSGTNTTTSTGQSIKNAHDGSSHSTKRRSLINNSNNSRSTKKWFDKAAVYRYETPRPVVTYMSRNFFSRGVLNEGDILAYVLARYNVTLRVTTFEEPLHLVMDSLSTTDVMFGMHGAGWTNGLFLKRGATTMQMFPYGWRLPDNTTLRGYNYREIVLASECPYDEWVNPVRENVFFRRSDYAKTRGWKTTYSLHPEPDMPLPEDGWPGNLWIVSCFFQVINTYFN